MDLEDRALRLTGSHWGRSHTGEIVPRHENLCRMSGRRASKLREAKSFENIDDIRYSNAQAGDYVSVRGRVGAKVRAPLFSHPPFHQIQLDCRGLVAFSQEPLTLEEGKFLAVIHNVREEEVLIRRNDKGEWVRETHGTVSVTSDTPWYLEDGGRFRLPIMDAKSAEGVPYTTIAERFEPLKAGVVKRGLDLIQGLRILGTRHVEVCLPSARDALGGGQGYPAAAQPPARPPLQTCLPLGVVVTVVGELNASDLKFFPGVRSVGLVLGRPRASSGPLIISTDTLQDLISASDSMAKVCRGLSFGLGVAGVAMLVRRALAWAAAQNRQVRERCPSLSLCVWGMHPGVMATAHLIPEALEMGGGGTAEHVECEKGGQASLVCRGSGWAA